MTLASAMPPLTACYSILLFFRKTGDIREDTDLAIDTFPGIFISYEKYRPAFLDSEVRKG